MSELKRVTVEQVKAAYVKIGLAPQDVDGIGAVMRAESINCQGEEMTETDWIQYVADCLGLEVEYVNGFDAGWGRPLTILFEEGDLYVDGFFDGRKAALAMGLE